MKKNFGKLNQQKALTIIFRSCTNVNMLTQSKKRLFDEKKSEYTFRSLNSIIASLNQAKEQFPKIDYDIIVVDYNSKEEDLKNGMVSFAQRINDKGEAKVRKSFRGGEGARWDKGERDIIVGLKEFGIEDSFRKLFSYDVKDYSWKFNRKDNVIKR